MGPGESATTRPAAATPPRDPLRPPEVVMRPARMGSFHQTRISFARSLTRRMARDAWTVACRRFDIGADETGEAVYSVDTPQGRYSFVVFAQDIDPAERSDRVIAERWDYTFALTEGEPDGERMAALRANVPKQEHGRFTARDLVVSRGNKSARLFGQVVERLARGRQPSPAGIAGVGYLMRTTAVYGNGKFGLADYVRLRRAGAFPQPFAAQMLTVYLARQFSLDLVEHLAALRNPDGAARLRPALARAFGVGNATGLGMAPFIVGHPRLVHQWTWARETAIARVTALATASPAAVRRFRECLERAIAHAGEWTTDDPRQQARIDVLRSELHTLDAALAPRPGGRGRLAESHPWRALTAEAAARYSPETQELLHSLILEPYPELVDDLDEQMAAEEHVGLQPRMPLGELRRLIAGTYAWALSIDYADPAAVHYFWYRSENKEEPRLGVRGEDAGVERAMDLGIARAVAELHRVLGGEPAERDTAAFLLAQPQWRAIVARVQSLAHLPYAEVRDNLLGAHCLPLDLLRWKLSFFGAVKFDPKSQRWTRITLFQGAPLPGELAAGRTDPDDWWCPVSPGEA